MMLENDNQKGGRNIWIFQRVSAFLLLLLLGFHFHFSSGLIHYWNGLQRFEIIPLISKPQILITELLFISFGLLHGFFGIKGVVDDYPLGKKRRNIILVIASVFMVLFILGLYSLVLLYQMR